MGNLPGRFSCSATWRKEAKKLFLIHLFFLNRVSTSPAFRPAPAHLSSSHYASSSSSRAPSSSCYSILFIHLLQSSAVHRTTYYDAAHGPLFLTGRYNKFQGKRDTCVYLFCSYFLSFFIPSSLCLPPCCRVTPVWWHLAVTPKLSSHHLLHSILQQNNLHPRLFMVSLLLAEVWAFFLSFFLPPRCLVDCCLLLFSPATVHQSYPHHATQLHPHQPQPATTPTGNQQQTQHAAPSPVQVLGGRGRNQLWSYCIGDTYCLSWHSTPCYLILCLKLILEHHDPSSSRNSRLAWKAVLLLKWCSVYLGSWNCCYKIEAPGTNYNVCMLYMGGKALNKMLLFLWVLIQY